MAQSPNIAQRIINKCGGPHAVAQMTGASVSRVYRWTYAKARGGTGGVIPARHHRPLLSEARKRGIDLRPEDFFDLPPGGVEARR